METPLGADQLRLKCISSLRTPDAIYRTQQERWMIGMDGERERERQTDRQTDRDREIERDRETELRDSVLSAQLDDDDDDDDDDDISHL